MSLIHLWSHRGFKEVGWRRPRDSAQDCGMVGCLHCGWNSKPMLNSYTLLLLFGLFVLCPLGMLYKPMWPWMSHDAGASVSRKEMYSSKVEPTRPSVFCFFYGEGVVLARFPNPELQDRPECDIFHICKPTRNSWKTLVHLRYIQKNWE